jgi:hypothetical protein
MTTGNPNFAMYYPIQCHLGISKRHLDALDPARVRDGRVIGQDNMDNLMVSTMFSAIAVEAALNEYVLSHCLFLDLEYLQKAFRDITKQFMRSSIQNKLHLLLECWPQEFPDELVKDVRRLIDIRNKITHQAGSIKTESETSDRRGTMGNFQLDAADGAHMLRHHDIAQDFLSRFWYPGNDEIATAGA